ncbi:hypothetical protein [Polyangium jinanense]|uniref:DUF2845 domain-containing protein n=1 Tax=Polyangium jinanense TaxID=2829994 RepID=A0A9X3WZG9_9BACT|nr:hypothetical protein [Polyangium jinanense]MDC3979800.1 hypothetical protein [Polyangium jinanense]
MDLMIAFVVTFGIATAIAAALLSARDRLRKRREQARLQAIAQREAEQKAARLEDLISRFGERDATRIIDGTIWQGATREMVIEALGEPLDIDERVTAKQTRHIFKYHQLGKNRYGLRVTLEDDLVVGWETKG